MISIDQILKNVNAGADALGLDVKTRAHFNQYFQELTKIASDPKMSKELKDKKLTLLSEEFTEKIDLDGLKGNK